MADQKPTAPRITDITAPGKSAPSVTSKPVLISHKPMVQDPMVKDQASETSDPSAPAESTEIKVPVRRAALVLQPDEGAKAAVEEAAKADAAAGETTEPQATEPEKAQADTSQESKPVEEAKPAEEKPPAEPTPAEPSPAQESKAAETSETPSTDVDQKTDQLTTPQEEADAEAKKLAEHEATIQKMALSKEYYLPINAVEKRRTKHFIILGIILSVVLVVLWVDIALDAGLIKLGGLKPVTHFFST